MFINGLGAAATGVTMIVVLTAKFLEGAWVIMLLVPAMLLFMKLVHRHYSQVGVEIVSDEPVDLSNLQAPIVVVPVAKWSRMSQKALRVAYTVSHKVRVVQVSAGTETENEFCEEWAPFATTPALQAGLPPPELVIRDSAYRQVLRPILAYILEVEAQNPEREIAVVLTSLVEYRWYHYFFHNQRAEVLKTWLTMRGGGALSSSMSPGT